MLLNYDRRPARRAKHMVGRMKSAEDAERERDELVTLVGRFLLSFGSIEDCTYRILQTIPRDSIYKTASRLPFGRRVALIVEILEGHDEISEESRMRLIAALKRCVNLAETRNTIAHSPLMLSIYEHPTEEWIAFENSIASFRNHDKPITPKMVAESLAESEILIRDLYDVLGPVFAAKQIAT